MSQKKMEAYKEAKKNKRQNEKKRKRNQILGWILGILIAAVLIGGSAYLVYYTSVIRPQQQQAALEAELEAEDENAGDLEGTDADNIITIPADSLDAGGADTDDADTDGTDTSDADTAEEGADVAVDGTEAAE